MLAYLGHHHSQLQWVLWPLPLQYNKLTTTPLDLPEVAHINKVTTSFIESNTGQVWMYTEQFTWLMSWSDNEHKKGLIDAHCYILRT